MALNHLSYDPASPEQLRENILYTKDTILKHFESNTCICDGRKTEYWSITSMINSIYLLAQQIHLLSQLSDSLPEDISLEFIPTSVLFLSRCRDLQSLWSHMCFQGLVTCYSTIIPSFLATPFISFVLRGFSFVIDGVDYLITAGLFILVHICIFG